MGTIVAKIEDYEFHEARYSGNLRVHERAQRIWGPALAVYYKSFKVAAFRKQFLWIHEDHGISCANDRINMFGGAKPVATQVPRIPGATVQAPSVPLPPSPVEERSFKIDLGTELWFIGRLVAGHRAHPAATSTTSPRRGSWLTNGPTPRSLTVVCSPTPPTATAKPTSARFVCVLLTMRTPHNRLH